MSPQPNTAPAPEAEKHPVGSPNWLVQQARELEAERGKLMEKVGANRVLLRNLLKVGGLSEANAKFVREFYPEKEKGQTRSEADVATTRKVREEARKGITS